MKKAILFLFLFHFLIISSVFAQTPEIDNGLTYLTSVQNTDGSWGNDSYGTEILPSTVSVIETLQALNETGVNGYASAVLWLQTQDLDTTDYLSERIHALSVSGADADLLISYMDATLHAWGGDDDYDVNNLDTVLSLLALKKINYANQTTINYAISHLISTQNTDGGWGFRQAQGDITEDSSVYMTAMVSMTLQQFPQTTSIASAINKAKIYLISHQNADGGFAFRQAQDDMTGGEAYASSVFETAYAYLALVGVTTDATILGNAIDYLKATQLPNGSWEDDPYSTALALRALYYAENRPVPPPPPDKGTVTGKVVDALTAQPLNSASVVLESNPNINTTTDTSGNFTLQHIPPGSQRIIVSLTGYTTIAGAVTITAGSITNLGTINLPTQTNTGMIKGTVTDASTGLPLSGVLITVEGASSGSAVTAADGSFAIGGVTPGNVTITASKTGYYSVTGSGTIASGVILVFSPQFSIQTPQTADGVLTGRIIDCATNLPVSGVIVDLSGTLSVTTDSQGVFLIGKIVPGIYQLVLSSSGYPNLSFQVMITGGITTDVQTIYICANQSDTSTTVRGRVTDSSTGNPISGAVVTVIDQNISAVTDVNGDYTLSGIGILNFILKASACGYDSLYYGLNVNGYGVYTMDFTLEPSKASTLRILSMSTDKSNYSSYDNVTVTATIENFGGAAIDAMVKSIISNSAGDIIAIAGTENPVTTIASHSTVTVTMLWNTGKTSPGDYRLVVNATNPVTAGNGNLFGNMLVEKTGLITIQPALRIVAATVRVTPGFAYLGATELINTALTMTNLSNIDADVIIDYSFKTPSGMIQADGSITEALTSDTTFKNILLPSLNNTFTFTESGEYPVHVVVRNDGRILQEADAVFTVLPNIRIETTKSVAPEVVLPDGTGKVKVTIELKAVEKQ